MDEDPAWLREHTRQLAQYWKGVKTDLDPPSGILAGMIAHELILAFIDADLPVDDIGQAIIELME